MKLLLSTLLLVTSLSSLALEMGQGIDTNFSMPKAQCVLASNIQKSPFEHRAVSNPGGGVFKGKIEGHLHDFPAASGMRYWRKLSGPEEAFLAAVPANSLNTSFLADIQFTREMMVNFNIETDLLAVMGQFRAGECGNKFLRARVLGADLIYNMEILAADPVCTELSHAYFGKNLLLNYRTLAKLPDNDSLKALKAQCPDVSVRLSLLQRGGVPELSPLMAEGSVIEEEKGFTTLTCTMGNIALCSEKMVALLIYSTSPEGFMGQFTSESPVGVSGGLTITGYKFSPYSSLGINPLVDPGPLPQ